MRKPRTIAPTSRSIIVAPLVKALDRSIRDAQAISRRHSCGQGSHYNAMDAARKLINALTDIRSRITHEPA